VSLWQIRSHEADASKRDRLDTGIDMVYWCPSYGMYLAKHEGKRRRTKDIDAATHFARYGGNLGNDQESPDEAAGAEIDENPDESKDTEHENDDRDVSHDGDKDEYENDDRDGNPDDREGDIDAKNDDHDKSDATPKYRILELLRKSVK
jgi:hypothetical protein